MCVVVPYPERRGGYYFDKVYRSVVLRGLFFGRCVVHTWMDCKGALLVSVYLGFDAVFTVFYVRVTSDRIQVLTIVYQWQAWSEWLYLSERCVQLRSGGTFKPLANVCCRNNARLSNVDK